MGSGGSQTKEQLIMEAYNWGSPGTTLAFTLRNVGSAPVVVAAIYLGGISQGAVTSSVAIGTSVPFSLTVVSATSFTPGAAYTLKVVSSTGGVFAFSVIQGSSG